ncbi:MAG: LuxR C-terminal-related transcriptional regulator [Proteobacteria bacterium]|nr:LuxR C-terminal-related transcriptional regulator [Pseudomonadota bacterium]
MNDHKHLHDGSPTPVGRELTSNLVLGAGVAVMTLLVAVDLATDARAGSTTLHVVVEAVVITIGILVSVRSALTVRRLVREARDLRSSAARLTRTLDASRQEADRWRRDARNLIDGLGAAIDQQFDAWGLSRAEQDIARLLLKGLSHKEIAQIRNVGETTVRQQAQATYRKAGLGGRNDLAAFFLEDLLTPRVPPP